MGPIECGGWPRTRIWPVVTAILSAWGCGTLPDREAVIAPAEAAGQTVSRPFTGIRIIERVMEDPPRRVFAAFISLDEPSLRMDATAPTRSLATVRDWAEANGALVATNGDFYAFTDGEPHVYGDAVGGGERWPGIRTGRDTTYSAGWFYNNYGWVGFGPAGAEFSHTGWVKTNPDRFGVTSGWSPREVTPEIPADLHALVSGFSQLVIEGEPIGCTSPTATDCFPDRSDMRARHPRTAMGLTEDRQTFILVVVDGRSPESVGMYGTELAALMHELGAWVAINLDGGASSQMYVRGRGVINTPSSSTHRRVLNHWGVFPTAAPEATPP